MAMKLGNLLRSDWRLEEEIAKTLRPTGTPSL
jgi:hypothetical protein